MKVSVSVVGRFHAFDLAKQLHRFESLRRLVTPYPKFVTSQFSLPNSKVDSLWMIQLLSRLIARVPNTRFLLHDLFDRRASALIPEDSDIFVGWSSVALHSMRRAKRFGALTIVDEGSSHVAFQEKIIREEKERWGKKPRSSDPRMTEKELLEYEEADAIAVASKFVKKTFTDAGVPEKKLLHIPYGVDLKEFQQIPKEDDTFRVIYCGALNLRKGVHYLLQAFHELDLPKSELWLIGPLFEEMHPFLKLHDDGRIFHKGPYRQEALYRYYSQGSVCCMPSIEDGFGLVMLEAMACGLPVIASEHTGGPDVIKEGTHGYIIPIRNVEALKEKLLLLYADTDLRKEMGRNAKALIRDSYTWDAYGDRVISKFRELLKK